METVDINNRIVLKEHINIESKGIFPEITLTPISLWDQLSVIKDEYVIIQRNLKDDTFNVDLHVPDKIQFELKSQFQINQHSINSHIPLHKSSWGRKMEDILPHWAINNLKFSSLNSIATGFILDPNERYGPDPKNPGPKNLYTILAEVNGKEFSQTANTKSDQTLQVKTVNSIKISRLNPQVIKSGINDGDRGNIYPRLKKGKDNKTKVEFSYNNIYLVPRKISRYKHNKIIYDVYMNNEDGTPLIGDKRITNGKIKTSETGASQYDLGFHSNNKNISKMIDGIPSSHIGYYEILNYSYYNYDKNKSVIGPTFSSEVGELIPYSLKGNYIRDITLGLNCDYDAVKLYQNELFDKAILEPGYGKVNLSIKDTEKDASEFYGLKWNDVKNIRDTKNTMSFGELTKHSEKTN